MHESVWVLGLCRALTHPPAGVTALSLLMTPFLLQASHKWLLLADPDAGVLVSKLVADAGMHAANAKTVQHIKSMSLCCADV